MGAVICAHARMCVCARVSARAACACSRVQERSKKVINKRVRDRSRNRTWNLARTSGFASVDRSQPAAPPSSASRAYVGDTVVTQLEYTIPPCPPRKLQHSDTSTTLAWLSCPSFPISKESTFLKRKVRSCTWQGHGLCCKAGYSVPVSESFYSTHYLHF
jgi:hypothetical protein